MFTLTFIYLSRHIQYTVQMRISVMITTFAGTLREAWCMCLSASFILFSMQMQA